MSRSYCFGLVALLGAALLPGLGADAATPVVDELVPVVPHIVLEKSEPADEWSGAGPVQEIRLFLSGAPLMRGASVRVVTSSRQLMRTAPPAPDPEDPTQIFVAIDPPLPSGAYVVQWRLIADDGHVMRGDFTFDVTAE